MSTTISAMLQEYDTYVWKMGDTRVQGWFFMQNPFTVVMIVAAYLFFTNVLGPKLMVNRQPFQLKGLMLGYNALNVVLNAWIVYECLAAGWWNDYNLNCQTIDYSPGGYRMMRVTWVYLLVKFLDLLDTVFFILRKKNNQVTYLHVYHHSFMVILAWLVVKFVPGGHVTSGHMINSFIHMVMYSYYLLSALGPRFNKYLWWKKYLTTMQLVQFVIAGVHQSQIFVFSCDFPKPIPLLTILNLIYFFYLFSAFYKKQYINKDKGHRKTQ